MFRRQLDPEQGLLLVQKTENRTNAAIHMLFVGMDLGVIWLDSDRKIVDLALAKSWKPFYQPQKPAMYILDVHPDRLPEFSLGDRINFE